MDKKRSDSHGCDYKNGVLPQCAPLALAYVPMQQSAKPAYDNEDALNRGTLFPGLDLPFMNMVNTANFGNMPLCEVMTLKFVCHELHLYLDTHPKDTEAFETLKGMLKLAREAERRYVEKYGPLTCSDLEFSDKFDWLEAPWPWQYQK